MATQQPRNTKQGARRSPVQALAPRIIPKHTVRPLPKLQEQALINLAKKAKKVLPIRALFSGPSGIGKNLAAKFLARKLEVAWRTSKG
jgi:Holliday junction resolvasome RuvABC ATP-dependent DNA helicase subunit